MMETQSDEKVAALKATLELQKIEMQAKFDQMAAQYQQIADLMGMVQKTNPVLQLDNLANSVTNMAQGNAAQMQQLMQAVTKKRRRVPIRDQTGEIVEVREVDEPDIPMTDRPLPPVMN
jgi:Zn/Cd-binding protein ZinT